MCALASLPLSCTTGHAADPLQHPACVDMCVYTYMHDHACICVHMHAVACVNMHVSPKTCPGWGPGQRAFPCSWQCCGPAWKSEKKAMHEDVPSQKCCQACSMKRTVSSGTWSCVSLKATWHAPWVVRQKQSSFAHLLLTEKRLPCETVVLGKTLRLKCHAICICDCTSKHACK